MADFAIFTPREVKVLFFEPFLAGEVEYVSDGWQESETVLYHNYEFSPGPSHASTRENGVAASVQPKSGVVPLVCPILFVHILQEAIVTLTGGISGGVIGGRAPWHMESARDPETKRN
jgi:hypothetical protein